MVKLLELLKINLHEPFWLKNKLAIIFLGIIQNYNSNNYWKLREKVQNKNYKNIVLKLLFLIKLKRIEAFHNSSMGTNINSGAIFLTKPILPHGLNGIIIGHDTIIGRNVYIHQQVTIAHGNVVIGDNVLIGAGAKILSNVTIGDNVKIGANCVVFKDIPNNATVVLPEPRVIIHDNV